MCCVYESVYSHMLPQEVVCLSLIHICYAAALEENGSYDEGYNRGYAEGKADGYEAVSYTHLDVYKRQI